jgi:hypothetical protein
MDKLKRNTCETLQDTNIVHVYVFQLISIGSNNNVLYSIKHVVHVDTLGTQTHASYYENMSYKILIDKRNTCETV